MQESKFNFSEDEEKKAQAVEESREALKSDAKGLFKSVKRFFEELLDFREDTDRDETIESIKRDIPFKGATAWILIFAIFVASIGLNVSSTAVVIGAMLISPLMGPILGVGMSLAINDIDTLKRSLINLLVMVSLSVVTAFLYFKLSPLTELTPELEARTQPTILDVFVAIFGGLALIVAKTKRGTIASVIFGVAIATALMPPLCTAGYGLAVGNLKFFFGATYLFTINTIFIALSTFVVLKILRFPMIKYANSKRRRLISRFATLIAIVVMIPASFTFWKVYNKTKFEVGIRKFLENEIRSNDALQLMNYDSSFEDRIIELNFFNEVSESTKQALLNSLKSNTEYESIKEAAVKIKGSDTKSYELISNAYMDARDELKNSKNVISGLHKEIEELKSEIIDLNKQIEKGSLKAIPFSSLSHKAKQKFSDLQYFSYANVLESKDFTKIDTLHIATAKWPAMLKDSLLIAREQEFSVWLKSELKLDSLIIRH
ncbi:DUF389 domain-containing protein [Gaetbulibacter saemankumensis]|uniref:DUF389 domain-containing protein n=1 Tax=Gaetbulibacter saemankumensis TaxID=311208 RepID=UPI00041468E0|nr:DUF389 domain-containing protein [Gaetbulibacter saemankumensis]